MGYADLTWTKGHGTENDFVIITDLDDELHLDASLAAALCNRRSGIGGDGLLRVVRDRDDPRRWFMDYRNADGSLAQMCGNGARVYVAHLVHRGLLDLAEGQSVELVTRAGVKTVRREGDLLAVDLGPWRIEGGAAAAREGGDRAVTLPGGDLTLLGLSVNVGNPHVVVALPDIDLLRAADLSSPPVLDPPAAAGRERRVDRARARGRRGRHGRAGDGSPGDAGPRAGVR